MIAEVERSLYDYGREVNILYLQLGYILSWICVLQTTGTRRAVVRSERFMEWQRELSSSRAAYVGRKRHDENDGTEGGVGEPFYDKSDENGVSKLQRKDGSDDVDVVGEEPASELQEDEATIINHRVRGKKQQQHQQQRSDAKKHRREHEIRQKQAILNVIQDSAVPIEGEGGRLQQWKQQLVQTTALHHQQQELPQPLANQKHQQLPRSFTSPREKREQGLQALTRNPTTEVVQAASAEKPTSGTKRATKRSKRVAERFKAKEDPPPPPLKLPKLHLVLSRKEIQEDWMKITGHKYSGKPKKSTIIQHGLGLCTALTCPSSIRYLNEPQ